MGAADALTISRRIAAANAKWLEAQAMQETPSTSTRSQPPSMMISSRAMREVWTGRAAATPPATLDSERSKDGPAVRRQGETSEMG